MTPVVNDLTAPPGRPSNIAHHMRQLWAQRFSEKCGLTDLEIYTIHQQVFGATEDAKAHDRLVLAEMAKHLHMLNAQADAQAHSAQVTYQNAKAANEINNADLHPPRAIVELQANGTIMIEYYVNGQRERQTLTRGCENLEIRDCLETIKRSRLTAAELKAKKAEREAWTRHHKVWDGVAGGYSGNRGFGAYFANKTVGARNSLTGATEAKATKTKVPDLSRDLSKVTDAIAAASFDL